MAPAVRATRTMMPRSRSQQVLAVWKPSARGPARRCWRPGWSPSGGASRSHPGSRAPCGAPPCPEEPLELERGVVPCPGYRRRRWTFAGRVSVVDPSRHMDSPGGGDRHGRRRRRMADHVIASPRKRPSVAPRCVERQVRRRTSGTAGLAFARSSPGGPAGVHRAPAVVVTVSALDGGRAV